MTSAQTRPNKTARATEKTRKQAGPRAQTRRQAPTDDESLKWVSARLAPQLVRHIDAHAEKAGTTRSDAIRDCLAIGLETITERGGIPAGRAEHPLEALDGLRTAMDIVSPPTLGLLRLRAHWSAQSRGVKVNEDELLRSCTAHSADGHPVRRRGRGPASYLRHQRPSLSLQQADVRRGTSSLWSTLEGRPVIRPLAGTGLELQAYPVVTTTWGDWVAEHPETTVLSLGHGARARLFGGRSDAGGAH